MTCVSFCSCHFVTFVTLYVTLYCFIFIFILYYIVTLYICYTDVTFEAVFTDVKLQECPEISSSHLCLHVHPRHPQRSKLHTELKSAGVLMRHRTALSLYWRRSLDDSCRCTRRTCKYVQVLSSVFIWTLLLWRLFVAAFHLQLYSESLQRTFNDTKSRRMTFL